MKITRYVSYGDIFGSTRQKLAAFDYFQEWQRHKDDSNENLIYFLHNSRIDRRFLEFCANKECMRSVEDFLEATSFSDDVNISVFLAELEEEKRSKVVRDPQLYAIIKVEKGMVHLDYTVNPDAASCQDSDEGLQLESYSYAGWNVPMNDPRLETDFWGVWTECNGKVTGGITLFDDFTISEWKKFRSGLQEVSPDEIKHLKKDGKYVVYAEIKT